MKNFSIDLPETGETVWISRSVTVVGFIFVRLGQTDTLYVLANKRGKGTPNCQGLWNCPGGFLDYDERVCEGAAREILEETGVKVDPDSLILYNINDKPGTSTKQNVTFRYYKFMENQVYLPSLTFEYSEKDEVEEIRWISMNDLNKYEWAFGHKAIIEEISKTL